MIINSLLILLSYLIDTLFNFLLPVDYSYQAIVITTFVTLNMIIILSFSMSQRNVWIVTMIYALVLELTRFDTYLISFLALALIVILLNYFKKEIGQSRSTQVVLSSILIFIYQVLNYILYKFVGKINLTFTNFLVHEVLFNLIINFVIVLFIIYIDSKRLDYLEHKDQYKRRGEKLLIYDMEDL